MTKLQRVGSIIIQLQGSSELSSLGGNLGLDESKGLGTTYLPRPLFRNNPCFKKQCISMQLPFAILTINSEKFIITCLLFLKNGG